MGIKLERVISSNRKKYSSKVFISGLLREREARFGSFLNRSDGLTGEEKNIFNCGKIYWEEKGGERETEREPGTNAVNVHQYSQL